MCTVFLGCSHAPTVITSSPAQKINYYTDWLDGSYEHHYRPLRELATDKVLSMNEPDISDEEGYLTYLSLLDASHQSQLALLKIKKYLSLYPDNTKALFLLAVHYMREKKVDLTRYFFAMLEKNPNFPWKRELYTNLGMQSLFEKKRVLALGYFEKAIDTNISEKPIPQPYANLGSLYLESFSYQEAERMFQKALEIDPLFEDAVIGLGDSLEGQNKLDEAEKVYENFINSHDNSLPTLFNNAALLGEKLNDPHRAILIMRSYIQKNGREKEKAQALLLKWAHVQIKNDKIEK